jgi:hypothetical protein
MTTDLESRLRAALHERAQRARLVNPDRPPAPDLVSMSETPRRAHTGRRLVAMAAAIAVIAAALVIVQTTGHRTTHVTVTPTTVTTPPGPSNKDCPLTAEEVSNAIGETVFGPARLSACEFGPDGFGPGVLLGAYYKAQPASACTQESLRKVGGGIPVDGLGVDAYAYRSGLGMTVIVCNGDHPFEVHSVSDGDDLAAAVRLAKLVLNR